MVRPKGIPHTKEWKKRMSNRNKGKNNPFYGKHHSEMTKEKIEHTLFKKGQIPWNKGKKLGPQSKELIEKRIRVGWNHSEETKIKIRSHKRNEEQKRRMRESRLTINKNGQASITIPKDVIRATGWKNGDELYVGKNESKDTAYIEKIEKKDKKGSGKNELAGK